jgi:hypothetical protein
MNRARFMDEQIVRILQEADRVYVAGVVKCHGLSEPLYTPGARSFGHGRGRCQQALCFGAGEQPVKENLDREGS